MLRAQLAIQDLREPLVRQVWQAPLEQREARAYQELLESWVQLVLVDPRDLQDQRVQLEIQDLQVSQGHQVHRDQRVILVVMAIPAKLARLESQV